jgi:hypothetical protein
MGGVLQMDDWLITQQKEKLVAPQADARGVI